MEMSSLVKSLRTELRKKSVRMVTGLGLSLRAKEAVTSKLRTLPLLPILMLSSSLTQWCASTEDLLYFSKALAPLTTPST
jgi:hypothetical protein